ncbi:MAG: FKBP-type peptidyl-prolyl cis-trans isomerase [Parabacteroides sp.]|nr:FKBP-type peptidyl-prolyl cis-trans isomerase [Parabacteroides sp.]
MSKNRKEEYREENSTYLAEMALQEGVKQLSGGVLYKVIESGSGTVTPSAGSVVSVHYRGTLINGREFDNSYKRNCPEAFRLNQVIEGWQIALQQMHVGDKWIIYIPAALGYGNRASGPIPGGSILIFEVELLGIA